MPAKTVKAIKVKDIKRAKAARKGAAIYKAKKEATIEEVKVNKVRNLTIKSSKKVSLKSKITKTTLKKAKKLVIPISFNTKDSSILVTNKKEESSLSI